MKICPRCQKTYSDDNLNFCLEDGTTLQTASAASADPPPTVAMNQPITNPNQPTTGQPAWNPPQQQYGGQPVKKSSKAWIWVLLILGAIVVICGGGFGLLAYIGYKAEQANMNRPSESNSSPFKNSNKTNSNSTGTGRTDITSLKMDMFVSKDFSLYGATEVNGDELTVRSKQKDSYYVVVAPEKYTTEDADARVTVSNVDNATSRFGYGLIFHSDPENPLNQDYAFVIDTARKKYRLIHHTPHNEDDVVKWTSSPAIKAGSAENTLEARDIGDNIDLYINDTKVTTVKNEFGFAGGVIGLYVGDGMKVVFKNLEIRR